MLGDGPGCVSVGSPNPLRSATSVASSPDGTSLYVGGTGSNSPLVISHFRQQPNGTLAYAGCIGSNQSNCTLIRDWLGNPMSFWSLTKVVSLNDSVYALSSYRGDILHFRRDSAGGLTFAGCIGNTPGCTTSGFSGMGAVSSLAVSPDGRNLYLTSRYNDPSVWGAGAMAIFNRAANGDLFYSSCIAEDAPGCTITLGYALKDPYAVKVAPDGTSLYVASGEGVISHFRRSSTGALTAAGCIGTRSDGVYSGCRTLSPNPLTSATDVEISGDGTSVYVSGNTSVSHFVRQANGDLGFGGCIGAGFPGCADVRSGGLALGSVRRLAMSLDGHSLYAVTTGTSSGSAIAHYRRSTNGALGYAGCIGAGVAGCTSMSSMPATFTGIIGAPFNSRLYVSGYDSASGTNGALYEFNRFSF
jgi:DNA-binding beta-propeller fold protein YncE